MIFRMLRNLFRRPTIRMGRVDNSRIRRTAIRNSGFVSFISENGCVTRKSTDHHESRMRRLRFAKVVAYLALGAGGTWVIVESVRALTLF
ncbi:hypothetical protein M2447_002127 [Ereboglobus sp. PH5-10]|nr:hypothetical protein [Ereboglobus sp. PH5-10]